MFTAERLESLKDDAKKYKRFFVTTAVSGKAVDANFLASIKNFCERHDALLLILPCEDVADTRTDAAYVYAKELQRRIFRVQKR